MSYQYGLSGYFPGSAQPEFPSEQALIARALELQQRGYNVGAYVAPDDPYMGRTISSGRLFYEHPGVPGYHFEQSMTEGQYRPPVMLPGAIQKRYDLEHAANSSYQSFQNFLDGGIPAEGVIELTPAERAYQAVLDEASARARRGSPIRIPR